MKKFLAIVLAALLLFACVACSSNNAKTATDETTAAASSTVSTVTEGKLIMATNASFPPYEYKDGDDFAGIDVEVAGLIAEKLGLELQIEDIEFNSIIAGVQTNKYDMGMAGMTVTDERKEQVNFTSTYATGIQSIIVPEDSDIKSADDLDGKTIGVQEATTGDIYCTDDYGKENVVEYKTGNDAVQALVAGKVDCVIIDNQPAKSYVASNDGLTILDTEYVQEDYAICINKDNTDLLNAVNTALEELIADGSVQAVIDKYITE